MEKKPGFWARLLGRGPMLSAGAALAQLAGRAMLMSPAGLDNLLTSAREIQGNTAHSDGEGGLEGSTPESLVSVQNGIGILKVHGPLFQRWSLFAWWFGGTGYDVIAGALQMLLADAGVKMIVLDIDSCGGQVAGCPDLVDFIFASRGVKPMVSVINDSGYSAAYWIASATDKVYVTRTAGAGSIGVLRTHVDISQLERNVGVAYSFIIAGDKKVDGNAHGPLTDSARADAQAEVDRIYGLFVDGVARNRGLDAGAVRATQAGCYFGAGAVAAGLADGVATFDAAIAELLATAEAPPPLADVPVEEDETDPDAVPNSAAVVVAPVVAADVPPVVSIIVETLPAPEAVALPATPLAEAEPPGIDISAAVLASSLPAEISMALIRRNDRAAPAVDQLAYAGAVMDLCAAAKLPTVAAGYIAAGVSIAKVRAELQAVVEDGGPEINTTLPAVGTKTGAMPILDVSKIYESRRAAASQKP